MGAAKKLNKENEIISIDEMESDVLKAVVAGRYDVAIEHLKRFLDQPSPYPKFKKKMERLVQHSIDLINAIRAKKNFPGMQSLTRSKQHELAKKANEHYEELQKTIARMRRVLNLFKNEDLRSTLWIVKAIGYGVALVVLVAFAREVSGGLWRVTENVTGHYLESIIDWFMRLFGI